MFDDLRDDASTQVDKSGLNLRPTSSSVSGPLLPRPSRFLGMTSFQRFIIAVLLMASVCVLGLVILFVSGKIGMAL